MKNLKEFKELIIRYETIRIEEITNNDCNKRTMTGFGSIFTCTLCLAVDVECSLCMYNKIPLSNSVMCDKEDNQHTYDGIDNAETPESLLDAYRNRAKHMRSILKKLNIEF